MNKQKQDRKRRLLESKKHTFTKIQKKSLSEGGSMGDPRNVRALGS